MKNKIQTIGGIAAIVESILYVFGFTVLLTIFRPTINETISEPDKLKFIIDNKVIYQTWILFIYVVFGIVLVPLTIAISENFKNTTPIWTKTSPIFGFIWSGLVIAGGMIGVIGIDSVSSIYNSDANAALISWKTIEAVQNGLGGGVEIVGGLWVLLISISGLKIELFQKYLHYFGFLVGGAGILTIFPPLKELGAIFGLTQIIWFTWMGIAMIKTDKNQ